MTPPKRDSKIRKFAVYLESDFSMETGKGSWKSLVEEPENAGFRKISLSGEVFRTNPNAMEIQAATESIRRISRKTEKKPAEIQIYTYSKNLHDGITSWITKWKANNWRTSKNKAIQNVSLWIQLDIAAELHEIFWNWNPKNSEGIEKVQKIQKAEESLKEEPTVTRIMKLNPEIIQDPENGKFSFNHTQEERNRWVESYMNGDSSDQVAKTENISKGSVLRELQARGIHARKYDGAVGKQAYQIRKDKGLPWPEVALKIIAFPVEHKNPARAGKRSFDAAKAYAKKEGLTWPINS